MRAATRKMKKLLSKASSQLIRRRFTDIPDLKARVYASLVDFLEGNGCLSQTPFDASQCAGATMRDISPQKLRWFLGIARRERDYALAEGTSPGKALEHMNLLHDSKPTNGSILLFGRNAQRFMTTAETKCLYFHGTVVRKPIPSYQIFKGTVFDQVDQATDFVLSKLDRSVTPEEGNPASRVEYEIPYDAVREAIVNAVAHRDYASNASVQVMLFSDRLEVWNPGQLPPGLTPEKLRREHPSIPKNPLICDPMFLAHYVEKAGSGTLDMIERCRLAGIPEPDFEQRSGQFVVTIWRDWLTEEVLSGLGMSDRQRLAIEYTKREGRITNSEYQELTGLSRRTAARDLDGMVEMGVLSRVGSKRGTHYVVARKK